MTEQCSTPGCTNEQAGHGKSRQCLACLARYQREYYWRNRTRVTSRRRRRADGLTPGEYNEMLAEQGGRCANPECDESEEDSAYGRYVYDEYRHALLCEFCNKARVMLHSDANLLLGLADYLEGRRKSGPMILSKLLMEPINNPDQPDEP